MFPFFTLFLEYLLDILNSIIGICLYLRISLEYTEVTRLEKMPVKFKISVVLVGKSLKVTIPKELVEHLSLKKGDTVAMWADNSHVVLEKEKRA
jgi:hypothetical protein